MTNWPYFSSDEFLQPLADVYFPGARPEVVACEGQRFRVLTRGKQPVSGFWAYPFPLEPLADGGRARIVPYLADVVKAEMLVEAEPPAGCTASPLVRWDEFATFEEFESCSTAAHGAESSTSARKARERISRDLGELSFVADDCSDKLFETILCWKAAQYARGGYFKRFSGRHRLFYEALRSSGQLTASSLRAGGRIIAGHLSNRADGRLLYRLPSYDPSLAKYSPGAVHLRFLLRDSFERGDREFDFLTGAEAYKMRWATHIRWLGDLGREPLQVRLARQARSKAGTTLARSRTLSRLRMAADRVRIR